MSGDPGRHDGGWVRVATLLGEDEARLLAGRLEAEGIPSRLDPEEIGTYYGPAVESLMRHGIGILVHEQRVSEARKVIAELEGA